MSPAIFWYRNCGKSLWKAILLACIAAIAVQPLIFVALFLLPLQVMGADIPPREFISIPLVASLVAAPFVGVIGIPSLLLLRRFKRLTWYSLGAVGFVVAALSMGIYDWSDYPGFSSGGNWYGTPVDFVIDGQKTFYGWLRYAQGVLFFGIHGLIGALVFFFVWRRWSAPDNSFSQ